MKQREKQCPKQGLDQLREQHKQLCGRGASWDEIWRLFLSNDCFLRLCELAALSTVRKHRLPYDRKCDISQEALLLFASIVKRHRCLGFRPDRGCYGAWLRMLIERCCAKALRQFRDRCRQYSIANDDYLVDESPSTTDQCIDTNTALELLDDRVFRVVKLRLLGAPVPEIAAEIDRGERTVYRLLNDGLSRLRDAVSAQ